MSPDNLFTLLEQDLSGLDGDTLSQLLYGARQARSYHLALEGFRPDGTFKAVREEIPRIHKALLKLASNKGTQQAAIKTLNAALQSAQRYCPGVFCELDAIGDLQLTMPVDIRRSVFERQVDRIVTANTDDRPELAASLSEVTAEYIENLKQPGRGGARRQAQQYTEGLHELARQFSAALPDLALSANQNSMFYRYALHWLNYYMDDPVSDPQRHIINALSTYPG